MDKRPAIDRSLLIPIGISVFSIVGILFIFLTVYLDKPQVAVSPDPTPTPFKYLFLATETLVPDPALETTPPEETVPEEPTGPIQEDLPEEEAATFPTEESAQTNPLSDSGTTPVVSTPVLNIVDRYDDTDPRLEYDGAWVSQTNVANARQGTLFVSNAIGNDLTLSFVGQQIVIGYLGEPSLGSITISIDDEEFQLDQSVGKEWVSPQFGNNEHFVIIVHESGDTVNLDYINVLSSD
ncbi:MAG TPA: hypothetical protein VFQ13_25065 [Anaerolineales bacterium]|nr:hypothetical protein [Anaerolineales bacterium]